jgi:hypothetical protein
MNIDLVMVDDLSPVKNYKAMQDFLNSLPSWMIGVR